MTEPRIDREADLHAAADGRLDKADQARLDAWLSDNPDDAATVHAYRLQNSRLHDRFDAVLDEPIPHHLLNLVEESNQPSPQSGRSDWTRGVQRLAASLVFLIAGGFGGWLLHDHLGPTFSEIPPAAVTGFADNAIGAHSVFVAEVRHPVEVAAADEAHLVAWLSKRLGTKLRAPNMNDMGFSLVGGRLLADRSLPVAQLMYQDADNRRLTLYVRAAAEITNDEAASSQMPVGIQSATTDTAFHFVEHDGISAFYWIEDAFAYALVAPLDRAGLMAAATRVYSELDR